MNILFISATRGKDLSPTIVNQAESLKKSGINVIFYTIKKGGISGYLESIMSLKRFLNENDIQVIHAHFSFCGYVASLASKKPVVVSLMGSDVYRSKLEKYIVKMFCKYFWKAVIVKSKRMYEELNYGKAYIIPNGVDINRFKPISADEARVEVGFDEKFHIIFVANPNLKVKNFELARVAIERLDRKDVVLDVVYNKENEVLPYYYNAADALIMTSKWEGSPNVIKEAMACNCPVAATNVGDISERLEGVFNSYICPISSECLANKINAILGTKKRSNGRDIILAQGLDSLSVANKLKKIYETL